MNDIPNHEREDERLRRLLDAAAGLPREVAPPENAWGAIRSRIEAQRVQSIAPVAATSPLRRRGTRWWPLAAAAVVVFVAGSVLTERRAKARAIQAIASQPESLPVAPPLVVPESTPPRAPRGPLVAVTSVPASLASSNPALAAALDQYQQATRELESAVVPRTATLPPATREVVRRSLATIDSAIAELRTALGSDPKNAAVGQYLSAVYETKLDFLKRVRAMPGAGM